MSIKQDDLRRMMDGEMGGGCYSDTCLAGTSAAAAFESHPVRASDGTESTIKCKTTQREMERDGGRDDYNTGFDTENERHTEETNRRRRPSTERGGRVQTSVGDLLGAWGLFVVVVVVAGPYFAKPQAKPEPNLFLLNTPSQASHRRCQTPAPSSSRLPVRGNLAPAAAAPLPPPTSPWLAHRPGEWEKKKRPGEIESF
ncbi:hypothetical protein CKAH01_00266 [Colletotrichum kahawae]|uniref:Uncharacterized protein n=1 Tax=Colletotrichum kahawae TaxID=34407 RepID=A0AAD9YW45_COLKA|nr:hypothetical protein CKAH01_00266 [Colletotrichum kahawae]